MAEERKKCWRCKGAGIIGRPPWVEADVGEPNPDELFLRICDICGGMGEILK